MDESLRDARRAYDMDPSESTALRVESAHDRLGPIPTPEVPPAEDPKGLDGMFWGDLEDWLRRTATVEGHEVGRGEEDDLWLLSYDAPRGRVYAILRGAANALDPEWDTPEGSRELLERLLREGVRAWTLHGLRAVCRENPAFRGETLEALLGRI